MPYESLLALVAVSLVASLFGRVVWFYVVYYGLVTPLWWATHLLRWVGMASLHLRTRLSYARFRVQEGLLGWDMADQRAELDAFAEKPDRPASRRRSR